jgi:molybdenum cofactor guanylyltransferase
MRAVGYFGVSEVERPFIGNYRVRAYRNRYHCPMKALTAYVIAGGKSSRMGRDKAFLELGGKTLLERALVFAGAVAGEVKIVGDPAKFGEFGAVVQDVYQERGPLGGIHAALTESQTELNLMIGVDLPFLKVGFLHLLISAANNSGALVTVPRIGGHYEPLTAAYRKGFSELAETALASNRNKVDALFSHIPLRVVSEEEIVQSGFSPAMFRNVNTPADWKMARERFSRRQDV